MKWFGVFVGVGLLGPLFVYLWSTLLLEIRDDWRKKR